MTHQNKTRHAAGQNIIQSSSSIVTALAGFPVKLAVLSAGGLLAIGAQEAIRWLVGGAS